MKTLVEYIAATDDSYRDPIDGLYYDESRIVWNIICVEDNKLVLYTYVEEKDEPRFCSSETITANYLKKYGVWADRLRSLVVIKCRDYDEIIENLMFKELI